MLAGLVSGDAVSDYVPVTLRLSHRAARRPACHPAPRWIERHPLFALVARRRLDALPLASLPATDAWRRMKQALRAESWETCELCLHAHPTSPAAVAHSAVQLVRAIHPGDARSLKRLCARWQPLRDLIMPKGAVAAPAALGRMQTLVAAALTATSLAPLPPPRRRGHPARSRDQDAVLAPHAQSKRVADVRPPGPGSYPTASPAQRLAWSAVFAPKQADHRRGHALARTFVAPPHGAVGPRPLPSWFLGPWLAQAGPRQSGHAGTHDVGCRGPSGPRHMRPADLSATILQRLELCVPTEGPRAT